MDVEALQATLEQASLASVGVGLLAGFLFSFNPIALTAIPVSLAYVTKAREPAKAVLYGAMFILGLVVTHVLLGLAAGFGGQWVQQLLGRQWAVVLGPLLVVLGLMWPGWIKVPVPSIPMRARRAAGMWGAFALAVPFSVAVCPFCTPALIVMLGVAAAIGSPLFGVTLLFAFALGRAVPIIIGATAIGWLRSLKVLGRYQKGFEVVGGLILVLSGLYLLNAYFFVIPSFVFVW